MSVENNKLIDDLFTDQSKTVGKVKAHSTLGTSSITIYKLNKNAQRTKVNDENKENVLSVKRESKRACVARTYEKNSKYFGLFENILIL